VLDSIRYRSGMSEPSQAETGADLWPRRQGEARSWSKRKQVRQLMKAAREDQAVGRAVQLLNKHADDGFRAAVPPGQRQFQWQSMPLADAQSRTQAAGREIQN
jgi:hypothetical protein